VTGPVNPRPAAAMPEAASLETREALLRLLDRETAIARATDGRLAVLILELRRVDRLQALLRGPAPATTMALVLERLNKSLRPDDRLAAISDEQVCVILPRLAHPSQAVLAAVKLLRSLDRPIAHEGGTAVLRPCVGIATLPEHGFDPAQLLMAADISRCIAATREEAYHVFQGDETVETELYRGLDLDLERALRANELRLHFQPQVEIATGRPLGVEALIRWKHPVAGDLAPQTLIGIAERSGIIASLTFWIFNSALRELSQWRARGIAPRMAINLSVATLTDRELPAMVDQALKTWDIPADSVLFEIAESAMIADAERSVAVLTRLRAIGTQIAIDDFGSGFSSLAHLKRFPIQEIKVDRPFVAGMLDDPGDRALVHAAIDLAHHFGLRAVAEGVERAETLQALAAMGCDVAQGTLFSPALAAERFAEWWEKHVVARP